VDCIEWDADLKASGGLSSNSEKQSLGAKNLSWGYIPEEMERNP
jgi:hypothetical protein